MNWGEIQIESLKKMFLNSEILDVNKLETYKTDKKYKTYLDAMPQACNEAINYIIENGKPYILSYTLEKNETGKYPLEDLINNFKKIYEISYDGTDNINFHVEGNNVLVIKNWNHGDITIYYEAYIDRITSNTPFLKKIGLSNQLTSLIPLYIAGELYKDDDISMATQYLNEFINQVNLIGGKDFSYGPSSIETVYSSTYV